MQITINGREYVVTDYTPARQGRWSFIEGDYDLIPADVSYEALDASVQLTEDEHWQIVETILAALEA